MDALTFVRDLGRDVPPPTREDLAPARDRLLAEIADAPAHLPLARPDRDTRRTEGIAPVTDLEPRRTRGRRVAEIALAAAAVVAVGAAAVVAVGAAAVGGVALFRELAPDERSTGPVQTTKPDPTPPPALGDAPYFRLDRVVEYTTPWDVDTGAMAMSWADAEAAVVTEATVSLYVPSDPRGDAEWVWRYGDDCRLVDVFGEQIDPAPALQQCRERDLEAPGVEHRAAWPDIATGDAAQGADGAYIPLALVDGGHGVWDELPREPAALLEWYESRADTFERSWLGVMTEALALNQMPDDLAAAMIEAVALVPAAEVERDADGDIARLVVSEQLGPDAAQRTVMTVDDATGFVGIVEERSFGGDPGAFADQIPGGDDWTVRTTISATPVEEAPTASEEPQAGAPALEDLVISPAGLGPLALGQPVSGPGLEMVRETTEGCAHPYWRTNDAYHAADGDYGGGGGPAFAIAADGGVQRIDVVSSAIHTPEGIRVGASLADVQSAYPSASRIDGGLSTLFVVAGDPGQLIVEVAGTDASYWGAEVETVQYLRVIPADRTPTPISASDDVVGMCTAREAGAGAAEGEWTGWTIDEDGFGPFAFGMAWSEAVRIAQELGWNTAPNACLPALTPSDMSGIYVWRDPAIDQVREITAWDSYADDSSPLTSVGTKPGITALAAWWDRDDPGERRVVDVPRLPSRLTERGTVRAPALHLAFSVC
ncbi:hypothetical protein [Microbacterium lacusdiani]